MHVQKYPLVTYLKCIVDASLAAHQTSPSSARCPAITEIWKWASHVQIRPTGNTCKTCSKWIPHHTKFEHNAYSPSQETEKRRSRAHMQMYAIIDFRETPCPMSLLPHTKRQCNPSSRSRDMRSGYAQTCRRTPPMICRICTAT